MMKIVVCLKPIKTSYLSNKTTNDMNMCINPYDIPPLKAAINIKKEISNCRVICLSMGVIGTQKMLNRCIAMGADQAILLNDMKFSASDTYATSLIMSEAIRKIGQVDIIFCGSKSLDGETGQVPIGIAKRLRMTYLPHVLDLVEVTESYVTVNAINGSRLEKTRAQLPLVAIFNSFELIEPTVSLFSLKKLRQFQTTIWNAVDLRVDDTQIGQRGSKTKVINIQNASRFGEGRLIEGSIHDKSQFIHDIITKNYS